MFPTPLADSRPPLPSRWHGQLKLDFRHQQGRTWPQVHLAQAPLKVQRPFYPEGAAICHSTILHTAGGLVRGDQLSLDLTKDTQAHALITTAAASKIYGDPEGHAPAAEQRIQIQVADHAHLEWLPQETIVFAGARYRQQVQIQLATGATCLGWELTRFGRTARGERFTAGSWQSRIEVWQQGQPLWINPDYLPGGSVLLDSPHGLAGQPLIGTLFWVGATANAELVAAIRQAWLELVSSAPINPAPASLGETGVSCLEQGLVCRYRGGSRLAAQAWFGRIWQLLRQAQQRPTPCLPRVWPIAR